MKKLFAKILYRLYLETLNKKKWIEGCELVFNIEGHNYYRYRDSGKLPLQRLERLQAYVIMLQNRVDKNEFDKLTGIVEKYLQAAIDGLKAEGKMNNLQNAVYAVQELRSRPTDLMFHPGIMMEIAAVMIIRDDENPFEVNDLILAEKKALFEKRGNEIDFFLQAGLAEFLPNKDELLNASKEQLEAVQKQYNLTKEIIKKKSDTYNLIAGKQK